MVDGRSCLNNPSVFPLHYCYIRVFAANGSKFQMRAETWCRKVQPGQTLSISGSAENPDSPSSNAPPRKYQFGLLSFIWF